MKTFKKDLKEVEKFAKKHPQLIKSYKVFLKNFKKKKV